jgi:hypothetical protein
MIDLLVRINHTTYGILNCNKLGNQFGGKSKNWGIDGQTSKGEEKDKEMEDKDIFTKDIYIYIYIERECLVEGEKSQPNLSRRTNLGRNGIKCRVDQRHITHTVIKTK